MHIANLNAQPLKRALPNLVLMLSLSLGLYGCGGGAGDDVVTPQTNDAAIAAITPLSGVWDLPDDWDGQQNDEAYLLIKIPDSTGEAEVILYDADDSVPSEEQNCFFQDGFTGNITQSLTGELFLDVSAFPSAVVALLPNGTLQISEFSETAAIGAPPERVLIATQLGITENEIPICN